MPDQGHLISCQKGMIATTESYPVTLLDMFVTSKTYCGSSYGQHRHACQIKNMSITSSRRSHQVDHFPQIKVGAQSKWRPRSEWKTSLTCAINKKNAIYTRLPPPERGIPSHSNQDQEIKLQTRDSVTPIVILRQYESSDNYSRFRVLPVVFHQL